MATLEWIAIGIGIAVLLFVILVPRFYENLCLPLESQGNDDWSPSGESTVGSKGRKGLEEAPWKQIGGSSIQQISPPFADPQIQKDEPFFETLRVEASKVDKAKWRFKIRFVFLNTLKETIVLDDIHTRIYEKDIPIPLYATISYRGEVLLLQDNTILKDNLLSSLDNNDGYEITLVLEMTRIEGARIYAGDQAIEGPVMTVFGLLVDYYIVHPSTVERRVKSSDGLYLFQYAGTEREPEFKTIDHDRIEELKHRHKDNPDMMKIVLKLEERLEEHFAFEPIPRA